MSLQPITLGTRTGTVIYLDDQWQPVAPKDATMAKVVFDDGGSTFYRVTPMDDPELTTASRRADTSVHTAADAFLDKIAVSIRYGFAAGRQAVHTDALIKAIVTQDRVAAEAAMADVPNAVKTALTDVLPAMLFQCVKAGGEAGLAMLPRLRTAKPAVATPPFKKIGKSILRFDTTNPKVLAYIKKNVAETIDGISATTKDDIKQAISAAWEGDFTLREMTQAIVNAVGDDERGELIARTESMRAANAGLRASWGQAVDEGLLTGDEKREWITTESGACDECEALDGQTTDLDGEYPDDGGDGPPLHPNCRCTEGIAASGD